MSRPSPPSTGVVCTHGRISRNSSTAARQTKVGAPPTPRLGRSRGPFAPRRSLAGALCAPPLCGNENRILVKRRITVSWGSPHTPARSLAGALRPAPLPRGRAVRAAVMRQREQNSRKAPHNGLALPKLEALDLSGDGFRQLSHIHHAMRKLVALQALFAPVLQRGRQLVRLAI